jgi:hypothetical protein
MDVLSTIEDPQSGRTIEALRTNAQTFRNSDGRARPDRAQRPAEPCGADARRTTGSITMIGRGLAVANFAAAAVIAWITTSSPPSAIELRPESAIAPSPPSAARRRRREPGLATNALCALRACSTSSGSRRLRNVLPNPRLPRLPRRRRRQLNWSEFSLATRSGWRSFAEALRRTV